jgi:hypothetical protein
MKKFTDRKRTAGVMVNREINEDHQWNCGRFWTVGRLKSKTEQAGADDE